MLLTKSSVNLRMSSNLGFSGCSAPSPSTSRSRSRRPTSPGRLYVLPHRFRWRCISPSSQPGPRCARGSEWRPCSPRSPAVAAHASSPVGPVLLDFCFSSLTGHTILKSKQHLSEGKRIATSAFSLLAMTTTGGTPRIWHCEAADAAIRPPSAPELLDCQSYLRTVSKPPLQCFNSTLQWRFTQDAGLVSCFNAVKAMVKPYISAKKGPMVRK